ncbi:MAG: prolyl oligopeptidase family serine peptidase [Pseudomonadota bacterium]
MQAPFGTWTSPISANLVAEAANALLQVSVRDGTLYWLEMRPTEGGRYVLVKHDGQPRDVTPAEFNVRSRVHEYGGGSFTAVDRGAYFVNFSDQSLYHVDAERVVTRITQTEGLRYADCDAHPHQTLLACVREDHRGDGEALNTIVGINTGATETVQDTVLWDKSDFVAYPRFSPDGTQLAWISWDHPNMPWDHVQLWVAEVSAAGLLENVQQLNTGVDESILQPTWASDGTLYFLSDRSGWWNMHRWKGEATNPAIQPVHALEAELGDALWGLGSRFFALTSDTTALVSYHRNSTQTLALLSLTTGDLEPLDLPFVSFHSLAASGNKAYFIAGRENLPAAVVELNLDTKAHHIVHASGERAVADGYVSRSQPVSFSTASGETAHAYYYPPVNVDYSAPEGERPPLMIVMHGGPTGSTSPGFNIAKQFWTSRGIAVMDVNYRGSTGYGRAYRNRLQGTWGVADVQDAIAATEFAVQQGLADPQRLLIRGGSAGGFTVLAALASSGVFAAGANYYGVSDLTVLARDTHKFESRYLDSLIGPYPAEAEIYTARSPINALDSFSSPLITLQGLEDEIVPPNQSEKIFNALVNKGVAAAYLTYAGEQHGFRQAESIISSLEAELYFYGRVLGFEPAGELPAVDIVNLPQD